MLLPNAVNRVLADLLFLSASVRVLQCVAPFGLLCSVANDAGGNRSSVA